ncbi:hypothetical protein [Blautia producta]
MIQCIYLEEKGGGAARKSSKNGGFDRLGFSTREWFLQEKTERYGCP